jgi:hypothetical protein
MVQEVDQSAKSVQVFNTPPADATERGIALRGERIGMKWNS